MHLNMYVETILGLCLLRSTLDGYPRGRARQNGAILLAERCKLDQRPSGEGLRPRRGKVGRVLLDIILKRNIHGPNQGMKLKGELMFWRTICAYRVQGMVLFKGQICLKLLQIGPSLLDLWTPV